MIIVLLLLPIIIMIIMIVTYCYGSSYPFHPYEFKGNEKKRITSRKIMLIISIMNYMQGCALQKKSRTMKQQGCSRKVLVILVMMGSDLGAIIVQKHVDQAFFWSNFVQKKREREKRQKSYFACTHRRSDIKIEVSDGNLHRNFLELKP